MSTEEDKSTSQENGTKETGEVTIPGKYKIKLRTTLSGRRRDADDQAVADATADSSSNDRQT